jgi:UDP-N-acetylglucosamine transferase subunit ALG13
MVLGSILAMTKNSLNDVMKEVSKPKASSRKNNNFFLLSYKPCLNDDIASADLVISHAGAGSILSVLRMNERRSSSGESRRNDIRNNGMKNDHRTSPDAGAGIHHQQNNKLAVSLHRTPVLIAVVNESLMDNHQKELAETLSSSGDSDSDDGGPYIIMAKSTRPVHVTEAIEQAALEIKSVRNGNGLLTLKLLPPVDKSIFERIILEELGLPC